MRLLLYHTMASFARAELVHNYIKLHNYMARPCPTCTFDEQKCRESIDNSVICMGTLSERKCCFGSGLPLPLVPSSLSQYGNATHRSMDYSRTHLHPSSKDGPSFYTIASSAEDKELSIPDPPLQKLCRRSRCVSQHAMPCLQHGIPSHPPPPLVKRKALALYTHKLGRRRDPFFSDAPLQKLNLRAGSMIVCGYCGG
ncbi:hypothetical protein EJ04DRAFT_28975 [Polyplosphaeria fusca]|uniref:Uncharacterized protein n=1 Tax=Polyplosphaeria fusca TaxID=682080 RepID=A0A9P4QTX8_9PLEO|nr:hypothetical protein EJ04DRAFT_28975 [Polyplosphaeria fusca]